MVTRLHYDCLEIDLAARTITVDGCPVELTAKEFDLLAYLAGRPGCVFSREHLLKEVWQSTSAWQRPTTVTEHMRRLRSKLGAALSERLLVTVRSMGYRFDAPAPDSSWPGERGPLLYVEGRIVEAGAEIRAILGIGNGEDLIRGRVLGRPASSA